MTKKILILCVLVLIAAYLVIAATAFNNKPAEQVCKGMELTVKDSVDYGFITQDEVRSILKGSKILPIGKRLGDINVRQLENVLSKHPFIGNAECYLTSGGKIAINIYQRIPVIRIMSDNGDDYYLDNNGVIMKAPGKAVHVAVATGNFDRKFAQTELFPLGKFLQDDKFWNAQIEQVHVTSTKELELIPRVGNHILFLGKPGDYNEKFTKLQTFYKEALNQVGWNKYERISVEFNNQIICTKKAK
ncbi:cell division protein FtsQ [uncultured Bacteroides sp.]|uniref:cell division protein FtsQ/DivIB n=1 Tax=uncultured Bacteroides sp. TaxID=162156 RepID=UPI00262AD7CF|nr:cell division protein FtsQ [uncultured Bacteroides sp.]